MSFVAGTKLGRYEIRSKIAEGGMGVSVTGGVFVEACARLLVGHRLLAVAGHRVVLGIGGDGRSAAAQRLWNPSQ